MVCVPHKMFLRTVVLKDTWHRRKGFTTQVHLENGCLSLEMHKACEMLRALQSAVMKSTFHPIYGRIPPLCSLLHAIYTQGSAVL